ncbi:hypothetical protein BGW38_003352, partial [Lunasporangiospora selenospora]
MSFFPHDPVAFGQFLDRVAQYAASTLDPASQTQQQTLPVTPFPTRSEHHPSTLDPALADFLALELSNSGMGLASTLEELLSRIGPSMSNSAGSRYYGLVTGGVTPAAFLADWLVTLFDQNTILYSDEAVSGYSLITDQAMRMAVDLFNLPKGEFRAMTTSGSTASNVVGMAVGRQWLGVQRHGVDYSQDGYDGRVVVLTNMAHASVWKAASILGIGRKNVQELVDMGVSEEDDGGLESEIIKWTGQGKAVMVFLAFGEVNTGIFVKNTRKIGQVCKDHGAYLHIDGAFGIYARCSPKYAHLADGLELAHSITACGHKWLNVPYDCGLFIYRKQLEKATMEPVFSSTAAYLRPSESASSHPMNLSIENSQRFRALPVWATLRAYGREGYSRIVEENCRFAKTMHDWIKSRPELYTTLTEECPLNIVVFCKSSPTLTRVQGAVSLAEKEHGLKELEKVNQELLKRLNASG